MDYLHLLWQLPAIVSGTTMLAYLWPRKITPHFVPLLTFIVALIVLALPGYIDIALALVLPVALLHSWLGVSLTGHDPIKAPSLKEIREKIKPAKFELRQFVTRAYTPGGAPEERAEEVKDSPVAQEEPAQTSAVKSFVPEL